MSMRNVVPAIVVGMLFTFATAVIHAETVWDAYDDYAITQASDNTSSNTWQFFTVSEGANTGYSLMDSFGNIGYTHNVLKSSAYGDYPCIGKNTTQGALCANPGPSGSAVAIGWKSGLAGTVNVNYSFSITSLQDGNGTTYALYAEGADSALKSGTITTGGASGTISGSTSIAYGKMLYLQLGPNFKGGTTDYFSDYSAITFSVSQVPEPSSIALLSMTALSLLCYAWRKRK